MIFFKKRNVENDYLDILKYILKNGHIKEDRTNTGTIQSDKSHIIQHDMSKGFPLLTSKKMGVKSISAELEFFIKGLTDKKWLIDRKCTIWNEWSNPSNDDDTDLGKIYGYQWNNFNSSGYNQLKHIINTIKTNPNDRRLVCSAWNPLEFDEMALPPCHVMWGIEIINNKLNLWWVQRSCDMFLGIPYNIASYALLLKLIALETGYTEGYLTGYLNNCHIYLNHIKQTKQLLKRKTYKFPSLEISNFKSLYDWCYNDVKLINYKCNNTLKAPISI